MYNFKLMNLLLIDYGRQVYKKLHTFFCRNSFHDILIYKSIIIDGNYYYFEIVY